MGEVTEHGSLILASLEPDHVLVLGGGGERILFHQSEETLPKKHQLLLRFEDGTFLTVTVQGWGSVQLYHQSELAEHPHIGKKGASPLSDAFTLAALQRLFDGYGDKDRKSIKFFIISEPGILGIGNGYLQDILFRARIHPGGESSTSPGRRGARSTKPLGTRWRRLWSWAAGTPSEICTTTVADTRG